MSLYGFMRLVWAERGPGAEKSSCLSLAPQWTEEILHRLGHSNSEAVGFGRRCKVSFIHNRCLILATQHGKREVEPWSFASY